MDTVYEVWDTDTFNLFGTYTMYERAERVVRAADAAGRRFNIKDTGLTKAEYNKLQEEKNT
jgi:hypothetical protein